jgi:hypothetical protein
MGHSAEIEEESMFVEYPVGACQVVNSLSVLSGISGR